MISCSDLAILFVDPFVVLIAAVVVLLVAFAGFQRERRAARKSIEDEQR